MINTKALRKRRIHTGIRVLINIVTAIIVLIPFICSKHCIYAFRGTLYHGYEFISKKSDH